MKQEERFEDNETFVVENKNTFQEIKIEIPEQFFKIQNIKIEERATSENRNKQEK